MLSSTKILVKSVKMNIFHGNNRRGALCVSQGRQMGCPVCLCNSWKFDSQTDNPAWTTWLCFYQTRSAWSVDQGSNKSHSTAYNFAPTVTKFCVMWEGLSLPHDTKFGNCKCKIVDSRAFPSWSLIHGLRWSGLIKAEPGPFARVHKVPVVRTHEGLEWGSADCD